MAYDNGLVLLFYKRNKNQIFRQNIQSLGTIPGKRRVTVLNFLTFHITRGGILQPRSQGLFPGNEVGHFVELEPDRFNYLL